MCKLEDETARARGSNQAITRSAHRTIRVGAVVMLAAWVYFVQAARADICCNCSSASLSVSSGQVNLNEPVTITYTASYCRCVGGPCWHPEGNCSLAPVDVQVFLEGFGQVHSQTVNFAPTNDFNIGLTQPFQYTPTMAGQYTVVAAGTCPSASAQFRAGCGSECADIGTADQCPTCGSISGPDIKANKADNIIRTVCPNECVDQTDAKGETVTVTVKATGDTPDCYELTVTVNGAVKIKSKPADKGSWPGTLSIQLQGLVGLGSASVAVTLYKFDDENDCWQTSNGSLALDAKPDDDCDCPGCPPGTPRGPGGGAVRSAPIVGEIQLADVALKIRAGENNVLRIPQIVAIHENGDVEVILPDRANSVIFSPGSGFLESWILGGPPNRGGGGEREDFVQLSNIAEGVTYFFQSTTMGPNPFRLERIRRFDFTTRSSYVYDAAGILTEIHVGSPASTTYFALMYDAMGKLEMIVPVVNGAQDMTRAVTLVYDGNAVIGTDGAVCPSCGGERRRYYFNSEGLLTRITDADGNDLELFTYDGQNRLTIHQKLNTSDVMVVVRKVEYDDGQPAGPVLTIHERLNDTQERIRVERYDDHGRIIQIDKYAMLFPHDSTPSGDAVTSAFTYATQEDPATGIEVTTTEAIDPADVAGVTIIKSFPDEAPLFLLKGEDDGGWALPISESDNAFELTAFQQGDAELSPLIQGAVARTTLEVETSGVYYLRALLHDAANPAPGENVCIQYLLDGGPGGFAAGYVFRNADDPPPADPWLNMYTTSCGSFGQSGSEHTGWNLESGVTYELTILFANMTASPNPADGFGIDGLALTRFPNAAPDTFPTAPYQRIDGQARTTRSYTRGNDGSTTKSNVTFASYDATTSSFLNTYTIDSRGGMTEFEYNSDGLLVMETGPAVALLDGGGVVRRVMTYEYDENNLLTRMGESRTPEELTYTEYQYDAYGRLTLVAENAAGGPGERAETTYGYNIYGEQNTVTDPCGNVKQRFFGNAGKVSDEAAYQSGGAGNVLSQVHYDYDANLRLTRTRVAVHPGSFAIGAPMTWTDAAFTYDLSGRKLTETRSGPGGGLTTSYDYDYQGTLVEQISPDGSITRYQYDGLGMVTSQTIEGTGVNVLMTQSMYDVQGRLDSVIDFSGVVTDYEYDAMGRQFMVAQGGASVATTTYDDAGQVIRSRVADAASGDALADTTYDLDALGRVIRTRTRLVDGADGADDPVQLQAYDIAGRTVGVIGKAGGNNDLSAFEPGDRRTQNIYDALGRVTLSSDPGGPSKQMTYDLCGDMLTHVIDPGGLNLTTSIVYDAVGNMLLTTLPDGSYETILYDSRGSALRRTAYDSGGVALRQTRTTYEIGGRVAQMVHMVDPSNMGAPGSADAVTDFTYYPNGAAGAGSRAAQTVSDGAAARTTTYTYDGIGRPLRTAKALDPANNYVEMEYDVGANRLSAQIYGDPLGQRRLEYAYDTAGRIATQQWDGAGSESDLVTQYAYDATGRRTAVISPDGTERHAAYDLVGRLIEEVQDVAGAASTITRTYNRLGFLTTHTPNDGANDQVTAYEYDAAGRETLRRYPDHGLDGQSGEVASMYDAAGRLIARTDQRGITAQFEYDARGIMTRKFVAGPGGFDHTYVHDGLGRMISQQSDADNLSSFTYDGLSHLVSEAQTVGGAAKTVSYGYNPLGKRTLMTYPADAATMLSYAYDALGNNTDITRNGDALVQYTYAGSNMTNRRLLTDQGVALDMSRNYDHHRRITQIANASGGANLITADFDHNLASNVTGHHQTSDQAPAQSVDYSYDALQRVIRGEYLSLLTGAETFDYDAIGNRVQSCNPDCGSPVAYMHNLANEYTQITRNGAPADLRYDAAGNLTLDAGGRGYAYDAEGRLVRVFEDGDADGEYDAGEEVFADFRYDALGRRIETAANGTVLRHYYDGQNVLVEYDAANMSVPARWYVHGTSYVDERAVMYSNDPILGGSTRDVYYLLGNQYSVAGIVGDRAEWLERSEYDVFGKPRRYRLSGDADFDGDVDTNEFAGFVACHTGPSGGGGFTPPSATCAEQYDFDADGDVDLRDFSGLQLAFTGAIGAPGYVAPRPGGFHAVSDAQFNAYYFTGRRYDGDTGLYYYRMRYYSADQGRFVARDPMGDLLEGPERTNLYSYALNNPVNLTDPTGGCSTLEIQVIQAPMFLTDCGSAEYKVRWIITDNAVAGWVVQHVKWTVDVKDCKGNAKAAPNNPDGLEYWEAWEVTAGGNVWVGSSAGGSAHNADTYRTVDDGNCTKGTVSIAGQVKFIENYALNSPPWGHTVPAAGSLPTVTASPPGWSNSGTRSHNMTVKWDCCVRPKTKSVSATP